MLDRSASFSFRLFSILPLSSFGAPRQMRAPPTPIAACSRALRVGAKKEREIKNGFALGFLGFSLIE
jgi:hypothetical protein